MLVDKPLRGTDQGLKRRDAYVRAFTLRWDVEEGVPGSVEELEAILECAEAQPWPEVRRAALYSLLSVPSKSEGPPLREGVDRLLAQATTDQSVAMTALALAMRSATRFERSDGSGSTASDGDLARATALLEQDEGLPLERITAHSRCAIGYGQRSLFELEQRHYEAADALLDMCEDGRRAAALRFDELEATIAWACALREIGDMEGTRERVESARRALRRCERDGVRAWKSALRSAELLLGALSGENVVERARAMLAELPAENRKDAGRLHLATALSAADSDPELAASSVEEAIALADPVDTAAELLSLRLAAELEAARFGRDSAGLRYSQRQAELRWRSRLSTLAVMEELVAAERLRAEAQLLRRQAFLDDLTGLANRRGWGRFAAALDHMHTGTVSVVLLDVDHFKEINCAYGHAIGDECLVRVARILAKSIRQDDLAARLGGDEFGLVIRSAGAKVGTARAEAILRTVNDEAWDEVAPGLSVRLSIGVVAGDPSSFEQLVHRCDAALYKAKVEGGARIAVA